MDITREVEMTEPDPNPIYTSLADELGTVDPEPAGEPDDQERPGLSRSAD